MNLSPKELEEFEFRHRLEQEQTNQPQWSDIPHNVVEGLKETPQTMSGMAQMAKTGHDLTDPMSLIQSGVDAATGTPLSDTNAGKAFQNVKEGVGHTVDQIKGLPAQIQEFSKHPGQSIKEHIIEHPISSGIDAASIALPMMRGAAETGAKYAGRFGENQMGKLHGTSPMQFRKLGREKFGETMRDSFAEGDALKGSIGREEAMNARIKKYGKEIGANRAEAAKMGEAMSPEEMAKRIREARGTEFAPGGKHFDDATAFEKHVKNIEQMPQGGIDAFADRASDIKSTAAKNKLILPTNAETSVANEMSRINDAEIASRLSPEKAALYELNKDKFGYAKNLKPMEALGESKEALGKGGLGGIFSVPDFLKSHRAGAYAGFGAESVLKGMAANPVGYGVAGITSTIMNKLTTDPQSLGKFAAPLSQAAQKNGSQGVAATHYILSNQYPEYNDLINPRQ